MLQQTQVSRVLTKYDEFLKAFPTISDLARAQTSRVLKLWQGLGYNRRALNLKRTAEIVARDYAGVFPTTATELEALPGIGQSTRGAIMAFAYGKATPYIETNIRTVYIHFFFKKHRGKVHDRDIMPLIEKTLDYNNPREWYYALMDYGVHLKQTLPNPSRKSKHHTTQSPFKGSNRELRSHILQAILAQPCTREMLYTHLHKPATAIDTNLLAMKSEGFIQENNGVFTVR